MSKLKYLNYKSYPVHLSWTETGQRATHLSVNLALIWTFDI